MYEENKKIIFVIYKSDPSQELRRREDINISELIDIPSPNSQERDIKIYTPIYPKVEVDDLVITVAYSVEKNFNIKQCKNIDDILKIGKAEQIFWKTTGVGVKFKELDEIIYWINTLPEEDRKIIKKEMKIDS